MGLRGKLLAAAVLAWSAQVGAQAAAPGPVGQGQPAAAPAPPGTGTNAVKPAASAPPSAKAPSADAICRAIEQAAAQNGLPVEFFARVIWQESRFNARAVSPKGAEGIAQFMPATADFRGLADPFDAVAALRSAAGYLADLRKQFGNLGLAAAGYNAGPGRVSAWLAGSGALPGETRAYVAATTGRSADEWASAAPPKAADTAIPHGMPCTSLAHLILAKPDEAHPAAPPVPRWGMQLAANWSESVAWASYRRLQKQYGSVLGSREPIMLRTRAYGPGSAIRYAIRITGDDWSALQKLCNRLIAAGGACVVLPNRFERRAVVSRK